MSLEQIKNIISPLSQYLWSPNLWRGWDTARNSKPKVRIVPQWGGVMRLGDKLDTLYLHFQRTSGTKLWKLLTYNEIFPLLKADDTSITWPTRGHVVIWKIYISSFIRLMATKLGKVLTLRRRFSPLTLKSSVTLIEKKNFVFIVLLVFFKYTLDLIILLIALYIYKLTTVHVPLAYMSNVHSRLSTHEPHIYSNICVLIP